MTDFFTADPHFGHANIIKYCNRPFSSLEEMDKTIIDNINAKVGKSDRLFCIGDFAFKSQASDYLKQINCKNIWLIKGNHDYKPSQKDGFAEVRDYHEEKYDIGQTHKKRVVMFHYPILEWNQWHRGSYHIYGHVHGQRSGPRGTHPYEYRIDVGVDCHNFSPISFSELVELMNRVDWKDPHEAWEKDGILWKGKRSEQVPYSIREALAEIMNEDDIDQWWTSPKTYFEGRSASEIVLIGESRIWQVIEMIRTGHPL